MDAREDPKTFTSCLEAWHTIEDIVEDGFDAIIVVPYKVAFPERSMKCATHAPSMHNTHPFAKFVICFPSLEICLACF